MATQRAKLVQCTNDPLEGLWRPESHLKYLYYGPGCVNTHLEALLQALNASSSTSTPSSHVFIVTGTTLATKTPLIRSLETLLGARHASTFSSVKQHGPIASVDAAYAELLAHLPSVDTLLSVGGGSPIDTAKTLSHRFHAAHGRYLTHIAIPTTLSAAECTAGGGYTGADGTKVGFMAPGMGVAAVLYDARFVAYTPMRLLLSTGMRAVDHAVETAYHPTAAEMPWKALAGWALGVLAEGLVRVKGLEDAETGGTREEGWDVLTRLQLAAYASSGLRGANFGGGMGLSHALGHALGSPYGIPHGETSCLTLAPVVRLMAQHDENAAQQIARLLLPVLGESNSGDALKDSLRVAELIQALVTTLGFENKTLKEWGVGRDLIPTIVKRTMRGSNDEAMAILVESLVREVF